MPAPAPASRPRTRALYRAALRIALIAAATLLAAVAPVRAADPPPFTQAQLDQMLASIALFPDPLLAQVLMASTYPADVALAAEWAFANRNLKGDDAVKAVQNEPWDPSVQSLVAFPQVLAMLAEKPEWPIVTPPNSRRSSGRSELKTTPPAKMPTAIFEMTNVISETMEST